MPFASLLPLLLMVVALIDAITRPDSDVRHLPKLVWLLVIVFVPLVGSILWFTLGRRYGTQAGHGRATQRTVTVTPRRAATTAQPPRRRSTEEQLADLEREIKYYEDQARIKHLEEEIRRKRDQED